jgi:hypothetical protein
MQNAGLFVMTKSGYVKANGIPYYYDIRGPGEPLLLLRWAK